MLELTEEQKKAKLWDRFVEYYTSVPFGSMPKTNTDAFVYALMEESGYFNECKTTQDVAIKLRITSTKIRNLMLNSTLYKGFAIKDYTKKILECLGSSATFIGNDYISLCINDSRVKVSLQIICANNKIFTNGNFNEEILTFPLKDYAKILESFVPKGKEKELEGVLWNNIQANKWKVNFRKFTNHPIVQILNFGATCAINATIGAVIPTKIITYSIWSLYE